MCEADAKGNAGAPLSKEALWEILPNAAQDSGFADGVAAVPQSILNAKTEWESAVDALTQLVVVLDADGHVVRASKALERWEIGCVAKAKGRSLHELLHPGCQVARCYLQDAWANARNDLATHGAWRLEAEDAALGRRLALEMRQLPEIDSSKKIGHRVVVLIEDVTGRRETEARLREGFAAMERQVSARARELLAANAKLRKEIEVRRETEQNLRKSEECYRNLVDTMLEGMVVYDPTGIILYVNESLCRMFGMERVELVGEPVEKIFSGMYGRAQEEGCDPNVPGSCLRYEADWRSKQGAAITVMVSAQRLTGPQGEYLGNFAVVMDISDRKRSERGMRLLSTQLLIAQEGERKRIADELHDSLGQTLGALKFEIERAAIKASEGDASAVADLLGGLVPKFQGAIDEVRRIAMNLRPAMLDDLGLIPTLGWFCREYQNVYASVELDLKLELTEKEVPPSLKTAIYRIVQESFSNIARHARARRIELVLRERDASIELQVIDDGVGFVDAAPVPDVTDRRGLGLRTMRERAESTGGRFRWESGQNKGTRLTVNWPRSGT